MAETIRTARTRGASGLLVMRADSAFYGADVINVCRALGARFSVTVRMNASVKAAIARIGDDVWTPIKYPQAVWFVFGVDFARRATINRRVKTSVIVG